MGNPLGMLLMTLFSSFFCPAIAADDANSLVAHCTFDEGSGDVLHDRSGNGHDGKIVGSQWALQEGGCSLQFRGQGDCVDFGDDRDLKIAGDMARRHAVGRRHGRKPLCSGSSLWFHP